MQNSLSQDFVTKFPTYVRFFVVARNIDNHGQHSELQQMLNEVTNAVRNNPNLEQPLYHPRIANWRRAFGKFRVKGNDAMPSVLSLVTRARRKQGDPILPYHNTIVALSNYISLKYLVPSGADDLGLVQGDFGLRIAKGNEIFVGFDSNRVERPEPGEVIFSDHRKVLCRRWVWKQGIHTLVSADSRDVTVNIDILRPVTRKEGEQITHELADLIRRFCGGDVKVYVLDKRHPTAEFDTPPSTWEETVYDTLELRGYVEQTDNRDRIRTLLNEGTTVYQGFDPTKPSLHVGHLMSLMVFNYLQQAGNNMIFILGGGTAQVGDPSMRSASRKMLTTEEVAENAKCVKAQVNGMRLVRFSPGDTPVGKAWAIMLDNIEWLQTDLLEFAREITPHFSVKQLVKRDDFDRRIQDPSESLTLFEFIYTALQGFDYLYLNDRYDCRIQMGGNDQWLNIRDGVELIRSKYTEAAGRQEKGFEISEVELSRLGKAGGGAAYSMTFPLLMDRTGQKMGKTSSGQTIWLAGEGDPSTAPFAFYQYWVHCPDEDLERNFRLFTFLSLDEIDEILAGHARAAQHRLAYEVTKIVHGEETARRLREDADRAFKGTGLPTDVPTVSYSQAEIHAGVSVVTVLTLVGSRSGIDSRSSARRAITQEAVVLNDVRLSPKDLNRQLRIEDFLDFDGQKAIVIRFGKGKAARVLLGQE